jgi:hypothetical protein
MNLYQKLVEIQKKVRGLGKDANASTYQYVSGSKVLEHIRPTMDDLGVLLVQEIDEIDNQRIDYNVKTGVKSELLSKVTMTFTWIDAESGEKLPVKFGANGMNNWDKGLGSALTYAERYFLLKFFHIATDEDDVDALPPRGNEEPVVVPKQPKPKQVMDQNHKGWKKMCEAIAKGEYTKEKAKEQYDLPLYAEAALDDYLSNNF